MSDGIQDKFKPAWSLQNWEAFDDVLYSALSHEHERQATGLELIASENYVSKRVLEACGSLFTNKYAEGYPGKRYYGGCTYYDQVEQYAIDLAKRLFDAQWANVQPHSGANANLAAYFALLEPGDTLMAMSLSHGGHLTHGSPVNLSGKWFKSVPYGLDVNHRIDFDQVRDRAKTHRPKLIVCGATCYPRTIDFEAFSSIAQEVDAVLMADIAHIAGLVAGKAHPSPLPHCDVVTTTTHKTLRGARGGLIMGCREDVGVKIRKAVFPGTQGGPLMHQVLGKAVCFKEALEPSFETYASQIIKNAKALAEGLMDRGFKVITDGTDNHLIWVSLLDRTTLDGREAESRLEEAGITVNKNTIPDDPRSAMITSGFRLGTAACTTRGMGESEMGAIADWIAQALSSESAEQLNRIRCEVKILCASFPIY